MLSIVVKAKLRLEVNFNSDGSITIIKAQEDTKDIAFKFNLDHWRQAATHADVNNVNYPDADASDVKIPYPEVSSNLPKERKPNIIYAVNYCNRSIDCPKWIDIILVNRILKYQLEL